MSKKKNCGCTKCVATQGLDRVLYARRERYRYDRIRRILYEVREKHVSDHYGGWTPNWREKVTPSEFIAARNNTKYPGFHSPLEESDLEGHKLFLSADGKVGGALSPEGDMQNAFNNGGPKGAGVETLLARMHAGGKTLDAFGPYLPHLYQQLGFKETGRVKFNREYAPEAWDYEKHGEPDVVFMKRDPGEPIDDEAIRRRVFDKSNWSPPSNTGRYFDDWDRAKAHSRGEGVSGSHASAPGTGSHPETLATHSGPGTGQRGPVAAAEQGHSQSLRKTYSRTTYLDVLRRARQKNSIS